MDRKLKVGIILDNKVNKWALQRFEPLQDKFDISVFVGQRNDYDVSSIDMKKVFLSHSTEIALALKNPATAYRRVLRPPFKRMDFYYFSMQQYLKELDIVYSCDVLRSSYTLASLKEKYGYKFILAWWENIPYRSVFDNKMDYYKEFVMDKVDLFLPFTNTAKRALQIEGVDEKKIRVIYPGVALDRFKPGEKPGKLMNKMNIPETSYIVLYVGKLVSWKGIHNLVYAARIMKQKGIKDIVFAVAGKGAQKETMKKIMKDSGTDEYFRFLGFMSYNDMPDVYRMADVLVLPSYPIMTWQEQFGMVMAESMASGTPVISTSSGSIPEVVGDAGILVQSGDFSGLTEAIIKLKHDKSLAGNLAALSRDRATALFSNKIITQQLQEVLNTT